MSESPTPPPPPGPPPPATPPQPPLSNRGFLARLFDLSFSEFVTPSLVKILFVIGIVFAGLAALVTLAAFADQDGGGIVIGLILAPLVFFAYVLFARVLAEIYLILFKIEENTRRR